MISSNKQSVQISLVILALFAWTSVLGQTKVQQKIPEKTRILFLLDASGSMLEQWERPNQTRWSVAKSILTKLVDSLGQNNKLELGLRVYGHRSPQEIKNCKDTWLEVPFKPRNHTQIIQKLAEIKPKGVTPITYSLEQAANDRASEERDGRTGGLLGPLVDVGAEHRLARRHVRRHRLEQAQRWLGQRDHRRRGSSAPGHSRARR